MRLHDLLPELYTLSYADKLLVMQFLEAEITRADEEAQAKAETGESCPIWHTPQPMEQQGGWFIQQDPGSFRNASEAFAAARSLLKEYKAAAIKAQQEGEQGE
jgi:hypothetical protein